MDLYIYIYIYQLLSTSIHVYHEKKKSQNLEITISRITAGKKINKDIREKKEKANFVAPVEKNQDVCSQLVKRKKNTVKCCNATITKSAQY